jgi:hypothetical protein
MFSIFAVVLLKESVIFNQLPTSSFFILFILVFILAVAGAVAVYVYFITPKGEPLWQFLKSPLSELIGDVFLFFSLLCYQILWSYLMEDPYFTQSSKNFFEIFNNFLAFLFMALVLYFPPRILIISENKNSWMPWLSMIICNLPIILRMF